MEEKEQKLIWNGLPFKESMSFHWCDVGNLLVDDVLVPRFHMFCRKGDCKCFILDLDTNITTEFDGRKLEGIRICKRILSM
jgi:hypothetical protein